MIVDSKKVIQGLDEVKDLLLHQNHLILERINQLLEWQVRQFTRQWNLEMQKMESECPSTFMLVPVSKTVFNPKNWVSADYKLFVMCQYPSGPRCIHNSKGYDLRQPQEWWLTVSPWLKHLITFLMYGVPIAGVALNVALSEDAYKHIDKQVGLLEKIIKDVAAV